MSRLRWLLIGGAALITFLYYRPLRTYVETRHVLAQRSAEVSNLRAQRDLLQRRLDRSQTDQALLREARRLGLVRPGERLFIVKGIGAWQRKHRSRPRSAG